MNQAPTPVVTCTIYFDDKFMVIRRHDKAKKFGGLWAFPGGKVEVGETIVGAIRREVKEETNLDLSDNFLLVDSYYYGASLGLHLAVFATADNVICEEGVEFKWLDNLDQLRKLPRIPGIDYHIAKGAELLTHQSNFLSLDAVDYVPDKYIN